MLWLFKFGWAKPVPVNPGNFANPRKGMLWVSLAGPLSNLLLAFITAVSIVLVTKYQLFTGEWIKVLWFTYTYNVVFAIFNMLPIPPLDGGKVVSSLLPGRQAYAFERIEPYGFWILIALVWLGIIGSILGPIQLAVDQFIRMILKLLF